MPRIGGITMQEIDCAKLIEACAQGKIKAGVAALRLGISDRHFRRLRQQFVAAGLAGGVSKQRGKRSNNQLPAGLAQKAVAIVREHYADFGPTLACEMLRERHDVNISKEKLRQLMIDADLWKTLEVRRAALHQPRERRECLGELVQIDGSRHPWFEQRGAECTLLVYVDDATGRILHLHFAETESTSSYFEATHAYIEQHGRPQAFYADRAAVFRSAAKNRRAPTQFQRALDQLEITLICANSPQAKGRVERLNRTLQDRLVKALRMAKIDNITAANRWCGPFVTSYNDQFARDARSDLDLHMALRADDDLERILALQETRKLSKKLTVQHGRRQYLLANEPGLRGLIGSIVTIHTYADGRVELRIDGKVYGHVALQTPSRTGPIDVDSKLLHHAVDGVVTGKKPRNNNHRKNRPAAVNAKGVKAAKTASAQRQARIS